MSTPRRRSKLTLGIGLLGLVATVFTGLVQEGATHRASANDVPFGLVYGSSMTGDIAWIGNTSLECKTAYDGGGLVCGNMQNGTDNAHYNDNFFMSYVDTDADASTKDSSSADLTLAATSTPVKAYLYWSGTVAPNSTTAVQGQTPKTMAQQAMIENKVKLKRPGSAAYVTLPAAGDPAPTCGDNSDKAVGGLSIYYQCYMDVTSYVTGAPGNGSGTYWVADVATGIGGNAAAGWALGVVYNDNSKPLSRVNLYAGSVTIQNGGPGVTATISGFKTGPSSRLAKLGFFVLEGDRTITGDYVQVDGTDLGNSLNPITPTPNAMNGSMSVGLAPPPGAIGTPAPFARNPGARVDAMGIDLDIMGATIPQGAVSTSFKFGTTGDQYFVSGISMVFPLPTAFPGLTITKQATIVDDVAPAPGARVRFSIPVQNWGDDSASNVVVRDPIPAGFTYVDGTFKIDGAAVQDPVGGVPVGDVRGTVDRTSGVTLYARVGTGANATQGGQVPQCVPVLPCVSPPTVATLTFDTIISDTLPIGTNISNLAIVKFDADTSGLTNQESQSKTWSDTTAWGYPTIGGCVFLDTLSPADGLWNKAIELGFPNVLVTITGGTGAAQSMNTDVNGCYRFKRVPINTVTPGSFTVTFDKSIWGSRVVTLQNQGSDPTINSKVPPSLNYINAPWAVGTYDLNQHLGLKPRNSVKTCIAVTPTSVTTCQAWQWGTP